MRVTLDKALGAKGFSSRRRREPALANPRRRARCSQENISSRFYLLSEVMRSGRLEFTGVQTIESTCLDEHGVMTQLNEAFYA